MLRSIIKTISFILLQPFKFLNFIRQQLKIIYVNLF